MMGCFPPTTYSNQYLMKLKIDIICIILMCFGAIFCHFSAHWLRVRTLRASRCLHAAHAYAVWAWLPEIKRSTYTPDTLHII